VVTGLLGKPAGRLLAATAAALLLGLASGCTDGYSQDMHYGLRDDILVLQPPLKQPTHLDTPSSERTSRRGVSGRTRRPTASR
jgi:hypothetical protein